MPVAGGVLPKEKVSASPSASVALRLTVSVSATFTVLSPGGFRIGAWFPGDATGSRVPIPLGAVVDPAAAPLKVKRGLLLPVVQPGCVLAVISSRLVVPPLMLTELAVSIARSLAVVV